MPPDLRRRDAARGRDRLGREGGGELAHGVEAADVLGERAGLGEVLGEQRVDQRDEQQRVACRGG